MPSHGGLAAMASMATPVSAMTSLGARLVPRASAMTALAQRVRRLAVPADPVPSGWWPVGVLRPSSSGDDSPLTGDAAGQRPMVAAFAAAPSAELDPAVTAPTPRLVAAPQPRLVAVAVADAPSTRTPAWPGGTVAAATRTAPPVTAASRSRDAARPSIKSGPPKAPRRRTAGAASTLAATPLALSADAVPVMAAASPAPGAAAADVAGAVLVGAPVVLDDLAAEGTVLSPTVLAAPLVGPLDKPRVIDPGHSPGVERASSTLAQRIGDDAERLAAIRLEALGWRIVARNLRLSRAEIDLLAIDPSDPPHLVIVEVRRRTRRDFGLAEESVDHRKRASLRRAAGELAIRPWLPDGRRLPSLPVRVDLVAIDRGPDGRPSLRHHRGIEL